MGLKKQKDLPLIYSCSGCSNVAQLANDIAIKTNTDGLAEMSCIAGVGGKVKSLVKKAKSNKPIIAIDGCPLQCAKACLSGIDVIPDEHIILTDYNFKKQYDAKLQLEDEQDIYNTIVNKIEALK
ncbi:putative zinc-binding protein [Formosa haliotis]|uniref:putative zinc-binding protein n=1 Tax=Formosa haliotis TaxID=1555194 RepID=UPI0008262326|nr:putative zinc-binding protein [Formosa haliotis]